MVRLLVPPAAMLQLVAVTVDHGMQWMQAQPLEAFDLLATPSSTTTAAVIAEPTWEGTLAVLMVNWMILTLGYLSVALPATRVILRERDDTLTRGIREACRVAAQHAAASSSSSTDGIPRGRVVAVLGLLHVNGIAERLQNPSTTPSEDAETP